MANKNIESVLQRGAHASPRRPSSPRGRASSPQISSACASAARDGSRAASGRSSPRQELTWHTPFTVTLDDSQRSELSLVQRRPS